MNGISSDHQQLLKYFYLDILIFDIDTEIEAFSRIPLA